MKDIGKSFAEREAERYRIQSERTKKFAEEEQKKPKGLFMYENPRDPKIQEYLKNREEKISIRYKELKNYDKEKLVRIAESKTRLDMGSTFKKMGKRDLIGNILSEEFYIGKNLQKKIDQNPRQIIPVTKRTGRMGYFGVYDAKTDELLSTFFHKPVTDKTGIREHAQKIADMFKTRARVRRL